MKRDEFKKILKPLIKQCIREVIFEEGVLSGIVTEVAQGMRNQRIVTEGLTVARSEDPDLRLKEEEYESQRQERIKRLNESANMGSDMNVFEGTSPLTEENSSSPGSAVPSWISPDDPGVDIGGIMNLAGDKWKHLI